MKRASRGLLRTLAAIFLLVPAATALAPQAGQAAVTLDVGRSATLRPRPPEAGAELTDATRTAARFGLVVVTPPSDGPLTLSVTSVDADVFVRLLDREGRVLAQDDDSGLDWNARLVVEGARDEQLYVLTAFKRDVDGELRVEVRAGTSPPAEGLEAVFGLIDHWEGKGERALARGETLRAAVDFHEAGALAFDIQAHARCERLYERVLPLAEELDHALLRTLAQGWIGAVKVETRRLDDAEPLLEAALAGAVDLGHGPIEMFVQARRGRLHRERGESDAARVCTERALALARELGDRTNESFLCARMAELSQDAGSRDEADGWLEQALTLAREQGDSNALATVLLDAARVHEARSAYARARELLEEALPLATSPGSRAAIHGHLGNLARVTHDYVAGITFYEEVLATARQLASPTHEASSLVGLALCHDALGEADEVRTLLQDAVPLIEGMDGGSKKGSLSREVADLYTGLGDFAAALPPLDAARQEALRTGDSHLLANVTNSEIVWLYRQEMYAAGLEPCRRFVEFSKDMDIRTQAAANEALAEFLVRSGRLDEARAPAERAVELAREVGDARQLQSALLTVIEIVAADEDVERLGRILDEGEACFARLGIDRLGADRASRLRATGVFHTWSDWAATHVAMSLDALPPDGAGTQDILRQGFRRAGYWKGRSLLMGIAEHRRGQRSAEILRLRRDWREAAAERGGLLATVAQGERDGVGPERLARLRQRAAGIEARITAIRTALPRHEVDLDLPQGVQPESLVPLLADDVLIEFVDGRDETYAYVLREGQLSFHELGDRTALRDLVDEYVAGISRPEALAPVVEVARRGRRLHDALLAPLLEDLPQTAGLVIVPTPGLAGLPFEALVTDAPREPRVFGDLTFLVEQREIVYAPSTPVLATLGLETRRRLDRPALILGDPAYLERPTLVASRSELSRSPVRPTNWIRLPGTREETLAIADILLRKLGGASPEAFDLDTAANDPDLSLETEAFSLNLGGSATSQLLDGDLRRFSVIHCASHGWVDRQDPRRSGLVLSPTAGDDGYLSVSEILELDLDADLAVLSACQTGQGAVLKGEGVQSVARAFLYAGARTVVASLWPVDDRETVAIMKDFYRGLLERGEPVPQALHEARLSLRRAPRTEQAFRGTGRGRPIGGIRSRLPEDDRIGHPYFWAPFVCIGAPGR